MDGPTPSLKSDERAEDRRPRDLALLLLAMGSKPPRGRARDQQADVAGARLQRRVLERLVGLDPEPDSEAVRGALAAVVTEIGEPTGPTRSVCIQLARDWDDFQADDDAWAWLISQALKRCESGAEPLEGKHNGRARGTP
jgi:hypothetical protein